MSNCKSSNVLFISCDKNLKDIGAVVAKHSKIHGSGDQWWKSSRVPLTCPLTGFPIKLLPYPPFKLKSPSKSRVLVDGKCLALSMISTCNFVANGWCADAYDVVALGDYMQRCKIGPLRPDLAMVLQSCVQSSHLTQAERDQSAQELDQMVIAAKAELEKLRYVQEQRLLRMYQNLICDPHVDMNSQDFDMYCKYNGLRIDGEMSYDIPGKKAITSP